MEKTTSERIDGPTPNGGTYSIAYYFNDDSIAVSKEEATQIIIKEYSDDDLIINVTYGDFSFEQPNDHKTSMFML